MIIRLRTLFFVVLGFLTLWFLYVDRAILTPFVLAALFAYIFNPLVNFFYRKIRLPKAISIIIIYIFIISAIVIGSIVLTRRIIDESSELNVYMGTVVENARSQISTLPDWIKPFVTETLVSLEKSKIFSPQYIFSLFPQAISRIISFFIFLFSGFYFLKEGGRMFDSILNFIPKQNKIDVEILLRKMNVVLGGYLRVQIFLIFLVALTLFVALSILGVKFALILAIFSGFAEIVPIIGPITAGVVAALIVLITATVNFGLSPVQGAIAVGIVYFIIRQVQDYLINPHIMGKIAKLHPIIILFAVLSGGHLMGVLGLLLAVPVAASIRILLEFSLDKINERGRLTAK